jgi:hypothetical protein
LHPIEKNARSLFEVTTPYLRVPTGIAYIPAHLERQGIAEQGPEQRRGLNAQEFLLFRGIADLGDVDWFAREYGRLGLSNATRELNTKPHMRPTWAKALTLDPAKYKGNPEPAADWLRQAGLMDMALGLYGIYSDVGARRAFSSACRPLDAASPVGRIDEQLETARTASSWVVRSIMHGAAAAGLAVSTVGTQRSGTGRPQRYVTFAPAGWRVIGAHGRAIDQTMRLALSKADIAEFLLWRLLRPWVERTGASLMVEKGHITPASRLPNDLLGNLWLQFANGVLSSIEPRLCAWERCPGPPQRPGVFIFQWGGVGPGSKHRDSLYCHLNCRRAAVVARTRQSPAHQRRGR